MKCREDGPGAAQGVEVAVGDAAEEVGADVLDVLGVGRVDVPREIEVVVVGLDLGERHYAE